MIMRNIDRVHLHFLIRKFILFFQVRVNFLRMNSFPCFHLSFRMTNFSFKVFRILIFYCVSWHDLQVAWHYYRSKNTPCIDRNHIPCFPFNKMELTFRISQLFFDLFPWWHRNVGDFPSSKHKGKQYTAFPRVKILSFPSKLLNIYLIFNFCSFKFKKYLIPLIQIRNPLFIILNINLKRFFFF